MTDQDVIAAMATAGLVTVPRPFRSEEEHRSLTDFIIAELGLIQVERLLNSEPDTGSVVWYVRGFGGLMKHNLSQSDVWSATTFQMVATFNLRPSVRLSQITDREVVAAFTFPVVQLLNSYSVVMSILGD